MNLEANKNLSEEERRQLVLEEIEGWKKTKYKEGFSWTSELNNFITYLPNEKFEEGSWVGHMATHGGIMDTPFGEGVDEEYRYLNSELFLEQTPREFLDTIMLAIENNQNVSLEKVLELQREHDKKVDEMGVGWQDMSVQEEERWLKANKEAQTSMDALYEYVLPVYIDLRVMGYSNYDLSA